jgi:4-amino-4-deoxy-L-arabinose transferase-like glycosyltransferase
MYLALQTTVVLTGLRIRWRKIRVWIGRNFKSWQLILVGLIFFLTSATVSREIPVYVTELMFAAFIQTVNLVNVVLMAWSFPAETLNSLSDRLDRFLGPSREKSSGEPPGRVDRFAVLAAIWVTILASGLCLFSYDRHPHIPDEVVYLYHARYLADGVLTMPAPPVPDAFDIYLMQVDGNRWYPSPPVGWPSMLALGSFLGIPWLVNPLLAGLNILLTYLFLQEIYSRRIARISLLLLCFSPWYIFMAMNFMTHTFTLTCALVAALAITRARRSGKAIWGWLGGMATGVVSLIRPLEGLIVAVLLGLWSIGAGGKRLKTSAILGLVLGSMIVGSIVLPYNNFLTGDPTVFPIMAYTDERFGPKSNALGFGPDRGMGWPIDPFPGHGPIDALVNANLNAFSMNIELLGWSIGSLILATLFLFAGSLRRSDYLMVAVIIAVFGAHFFYYFSGGPDFGARYWYLMVIPGVTLTGKGIQFLQEKLRDGTCGLNCNGIRVMVAVLSLCLMTLVNYFPWRAVDKYHHYLGMRPDIRQLAKQFNFENGLVLIRGDGHPDYASASAYNPIDLYSNDTIYAWDRSMEIRRQIIDAYPDRRLWLVDGPSITHSGFKVVAGPLAPHEIKTKGNLTR